MENTINKELIEVTKLLYTMPFNVVLIQWLNEAVRARNAYDFIREKGLLSEYLCEREATRDINNVQLNNINV